MLRDYRMGQRLSGATISDYCLRTGDYPATIPQDSATIDRSAATIPRLFQPNQRLSSDYRTDRRDYSATIPRLLETRCPNFRAAFLIVSELAVANQCVVPLS